MHYYPFNLKDYLVQTAHLPPLADLAYRRLLDLYYLEETPIPNKPKWVANRIRLDSEEQVIGFVLREYFRLDGVGTAGFWHHDRCDKVIATYQKKAATARANGVLHVSGTKKEPKSDADRLPTKNHKPIKNTPLPPKGVEWFNTFWTQYPRKQKKPDAAHAFAKALGFVRGQPQRAKVEEVIAGLQVHLTCDQWVREGGRYVPLPATWLNGDGWNDKPLQQDAAAGAGDGKPWWETRSGVERQGIELGLPPPRHDGPDAWFEFMASVWHKMGVGPWLDSSSRAYPLYKRMADEGAT